MSATTHPVDSTITQGAGIPDDALNALVAATIPDTDDSTENLSGAGATMPGMTTSNASDHRLTLITEAHRHIRAAEDALAALRPYLDERGQFVCDITHAAAVGIGKLTVADIYRRDAQ